MILSASDESLWRYINEVELQSWNIIVNRGQINRRRGQNEVLKTRDSS